MAGQSSIPPGARKAIASVHAAAATKDFVTLKRVMTDEFIWNFGPDGGTRAQALDAWRKDSQYLTELRRVTAKGCGRVSELYIQCPQYTDMSFRAGFTLTAQGWRMAYFVAGD